MTVSAKELMAVLPLHRYQKNFIMDRSRLKAWLKARQIGGSVTATADMVLDALITGQDWNTMSRSQRQAEKLLAKAAKHIRAINKYIVDALGCDPIVDDKNIGLRRIAYNNGATLEALPCDPDTTAGDTVNWLIDEFPLFPKSDEIFGIIKPSIMHGKRMTVIGTPRGRHHKFHDLRSNYIKKGKKGSGWSWHRTTIEQAVADGLILRDPEGDVVSFADFKRQEIADIGLDMWNQEYMCQFTDALIAFLQWKTIKRCQDENIPMMRSMDWFAKQEKQFYVGVDVGRRKDLTVIWVISKTGDVYKTEAVFVMDRTPFSKQESFLKKLIAIPNVRGCSIDEQGIGMHLAENLVEEFGRRIIEPVAPTNANKIDMATGLKIAMDEGNFFMPEDEDIAADFESVEKSTTDRGNVVIAAPRSANGHGDRFWAASFAIRCAARCRPFEFVGAVANVA